MAKVTHIFPSHWAPAIIQRDYSSLDVGDRAELNRSLLAAGVSFVDCVSVGESRVEAWRGKPCKVSDFVFMAH